MASLGCVCFTLFVFGWVFLNINFHPIYFGTVSDTLERILPWHRVQMQAFFLPKERLPLLLQTAVLFAEH